MRLRVTFALPGEALVFHVGPLTAGAMGQVMVACVRLAFDAGGTVTFQTMI